MQDSFGRSGGGSPSPADFAKQLLSSTKSVMNGGGSGNEGGMDQLYSAVNAVAQKIDKAAGRELEASKRHAQEVSNLHKELKSQSKLEREDAKESKTQGKFLKDLDKNISTILREAKKQNTLWIGVSKFGKRAEKQIEEAIKRALGKGTTAARTGQGSRSGRTGRGISITAPPPPGGTPPGGTPPGGTPVPGGTGPMLSGKGAGAWMIASTAISAAATQFARVGDAFMNSLDLNISNVFNGLIKDENIFKENMRQIVYQTEGLSGANRDLETQYFNINGLVQRTGYNRSEFQKLWITNMQRGYKIQNKEEAKDFKTAKGRQKLRDRHVRDMKEITISALHTSKQTGISADNLNDMFMSMQFGMSMSSNQVQMVATGMKSIARDMGITGDALGKAIANAEKLMQKMADAGTLTAEAAIGLNRTMAAATKHNVEGLANRLSEATSDFNGFLEANDETRRLLQMTAANSGLSMQAIMTGAQTRDEFGQRELLSGISDTLQSTFQNVAGDLSGIAPGIQEDLEAGKFSEVIQKLNAVGRTDIAVRLQATFQRMTGVGIGEAQRFMTMVEDRNRSHQERMASMEADLLAEREKGAKGSITKIRELESRMAGSRMDMMSQIGRSMQELRDGGATIEEAQAQMFKDLSGQFMEEGMSRAEAAAAAQREITAMRGSDQLATSVKTRVEQVNRQGGGLDMNKLIKDNASEFGFGSMQEIQDAMLDGNADANAAMTAINQAITDEERALQDPMTAMKKDLHEINEILRGWSQGVLGKMNKFMLWLIAIASKILLAIGAYTGISSLIRTLSSGKGFTGLTKGLTRLFPRLGTMFGGTAAKSFGMLLGKVAAPLQLAIGAITGIMDREENNRGIGEAGVLGALTGGSGTGSMFSESLGIEKGSVGDKALGVAGATAWGAAAGAAIGTFIFPGVGTGVGALIGGIVGAAAELIKIFTEGTNLLNDLFFGWIDILWNGLTKHFSALWDFWAGVFTLDGDRVIKAVEDMFWNAVNTIWKLLGWLVKRTLTMFTEVPGMILKGIKAVFLDFPKWAWDTFLTGLQSLANNEWVGPIFEPILEVMEILYGSFMEVYNTIAPVLEELGNAFVEIKNAVWSIIGPLFEGTEGFTFLESALSWLKPAIHGVAKVIGFFIKVALFPLKIAFTALFVVVKAAMAVLKPVLDFVLWMVNGIKDAFQWLYDVLYGHSIVPDLIDGIIGLFLKLPGAILGALWNMLGSLVNTVVGFFGQLPGMIWNFLQKLPGLIWDGIKGLGGLLWDAVSSLPGMLIDALGGLGGAILDNILTGLSDLGSLLWDTITGVFNDENSVLKDEGGGTVLGEAGETLGDIAGGAGRMTLGAGGKLLEGDVLGAAGDVLGGAKDIAVGAVDGIIDTGAAVLDAVNPLNWFDKGTRKIASDGVAMLHKGEMVVPESIWSQIAAAGTGPFGTGGGIWDSISSFLTDPLGLSSGGIVGSVMSGVGGMFGNDGIDVDEADEIPTATMSIEEWLQKLDHRLGELVQVNTAILGAFTGETVGEAMSQAIDKGNKELTEDMSKELGDKVKESVKEGAKEAEKEFGERELLEFIAKDIGRVREVMTGEYSAMSEALMKASDTSEKTGEVTTTELGALNKKETATAQAEASQQMVEKEKSVWGQFASAMSDTFGLDSIASGTERIMSGDVLGGAFEFGGGILDGLMGSTDEVIGGFLSGNIWEPGQMFSGNTGIGSVLSSVFGSDKSNLVESSTRDLGAFNQAEVKEASELASTKVVEGAVEDVEGSPLAGKSIPGMGGGKAGSLMGVLQSIDTNVFSIASNIYDMLNIMGSAYGMTPDMLASAAFSSAYSQGGATSTSSMLGAFSASETSEANAFGTSSIVNGLTSAWDWFADNTTVGSGIDNIIKNIADNWGIGGDISATNLGAFEKFQAQNDSMTEESITDRMTNMFGLSGVNEVFDSVREYFDDATGGAEGSLSKAMYYDMTDGEGGSAGYMDWMKAEASAGVSPNPMDYSDSIKGQVNPRMMNDQQLESAIQSRMMTAQNAMAEAMKEGSGASDTEYFKLMVQFLEVIAANTTPEQFSQIVGNTKFGMPPARNTGIKRTANDLLSSYWNIQHGEGSTGNVNNDGRG